MNAAKLTIAFGGNDRIKALRDHLIKIKSHSDNLTIIVLISAHENHGIFQEAFDRIQTSQHLVIVNKSDEKWFVDDENNIMMNH